VDETSMLQARRTEVQEKRALSPRRPKVVDDLCSSTGVNNPSAFASTQK
jgi:hypothetical protein